jgi:hypothetical protein
VSDALKTKIEEGLATIKTGPDTVAQCKAAFRLLAQLIEEIHDLDEPALFTIEGQEREAGTLEYVCYAGLDAAALIPDAQLLLLKMVQARARVLQPKALTKAIQLRVAEATEAVKRFALKHQVGQVPGLQKSDRPRQGTWALDAQFARRQLAQRLNEAEAPQPVQPTFNIDSALYRLQCCLEGVNPPDKAVQAIVENILAHASPQHVKLLNLLRDHTHRLQGDARRAIEQALKQRPQDPTPDPNDPTDADDASPLPDDWPWWPLTRGKRAVMIGGEVRPKQREMLERAFGFKQLKWHRTNVRKDQTLADQIRRHQVEFVIFTRFAQHQETYIIKPACQAANVPTVRLSHGYGARELQVLIEANFARPQPADASDAQPSEAPAP